MIKTIRPHHGMCFQFYEGKGYSTDFNNHMSKIIKELASDPSQKVILKIETDEVCTNCPKNNLGICETQDKVLRYDNETLKAIGLKEGSEVPYSEFTKFIKEKILSKGLRESICGDCSWNYICKGKE